MRVALFGDASFHGKYDISKSSDAIGYFETVQDISKSCDFSILNLESPLTERTHTMVCKGAYLRSSIKTAGLLREIGITHVSLANNHIFDYGEHGAEDTMRALKDERIGFFGLGDGPIELQLGIDKVLLDGFCCYSANGVFYGHSKGKTNLLTPETLFAFAEKAYMKHCLPIASVHFGIERLHAPSIEHLRLFRSLADKYPYVLDGNHPHVMQGYENRKGSMLFYAHGNLCFDDVSSTSVGRSIVQSEETRKSYAAILTIEGNRVIGTEIITLKANASGSINKVPETISELEEYCRLLEESETAIEELRAKEQKLAGNSVERRGAGFYFNRLNYKYIGAYMNGKLHARAYHRIMNDYFTKVPKK